MATRLPTVEDRMKMMGLHVQEIGGVEGPGLIAGGSCKVKITLLRTNRTLLQTIVPGGIARGDEVGRKLCRMLAEEIWSL